MKKVYIRSTGSYLPEKTISNEVLQEALSLPEGWIFSRTGIRERRMADDHQFASDMGYLAAMQALKIAVMDPSAVELIIVATVSPDYIVPSTACLIQKLLGARRAVAFDIQAACTGMIYATVLAKACILSGMYNNVLVIATDKLSSVVDEKDRDTRSLFGDGAAAFFLVNTPPGLRIDGDVLGSDGEGENALLIPGGGSRCPTSRFSVENRLHYIKMRGKEVFRHAVYRMGQMIEVSFSCIEDMSLHLAYLVPHQANGRIIEAIQKKYQIAEEKIVKIFEKCGNTSASSIGMGLHWLLSQKRLQKGDCILIVAFGAGYTWGSLLLTFDTDTS